MEKEHEENIWRMLFLWRRKKRKRYGGNVRRRKRFFRRKRKTKKEIICIVSIFSIIGLLLSSPFQKHMTSWVCWLFLYLSLCLSLYFLRPCLPRIIFRILSSRGLRRLKNQRQRLALQAWDLKWLPLKPLLLLKSSSDVMKCQLLLKSEYNRIDQTMLEKTFSGLTF